MAQTPNASSLLTVYVSLKWIDFFLKRQRCTVRLCGCSFVFSLIASSFKNAYFWFACMHKGAFIGCDRLLTTCTPHMQHILCTHLASSCSAITAGILPPHIICVIRCTALYWYTTLVHYSVTYCNLLFAAIIICRRIIV
jgi:hypothetical protein